MIDDPSNIRLHNDNFINQWTKALSVSYPRIYFRDVTNETDHWISPNRKLENDENSLKVCRIFVSLLD